MVSVRAARSDLTFGVVVAVTCLAAAYAATAGSGARLALAGTCCVLVIGVLFVAPRHLLFGLVVWMFLLGFLRRIATTAGLTTGSDPLLLVGPIVLAGLALVATRRRNGVPSTTLARGVVVLSGLLILGAANPAQGGVAVGVSGLLFTLAPMLSFWIGRYLCPDEMLRKILRLVVSLALLAAVYGLVQTLVGLPSWDSRWVASSGYAALMVGHVVRPFASFSSAAEYADVLGIAFLLAAILRVQGWRSINTLGLLGLFGLALILESSRGTVVMLALTIGVVLAARYRLSSGFGLIAAAASVAVLLFIVPRIAPAGGGGGAVAPLVQHQVQGLSNPLDPQSSTLLLHVSLISEGFSVAVHDPVGQGTGAVTRAAAKFGSQEHQTEFDPSNVAVALGFPGLIVYLVVLLSGLRSVYIIARRRRDQLALAALAVVVITAFKWMNGGEYAVAPLPWLMMGWADRARLGASTAEWTEE